MKIIQEGKIIKMYLNNIQNIDFKDTCVIEDYFRNLFSKLRKKLNLNFTGLYDVNIYLDKIYGAIIELKKEDIEYLDYYENEIDMRILVHEATFLYCVDDLFSIDKKIIKNIYSYRKKIYLEPNNFINIGSKAKLMEMGEVYYKTEDIIKYGKKITQTI